MRLPSWHRIGHVVADAAVAAVAWWLAFQLRFDVVPYWANTLWRATLPWVVVLTIAVFVLNGLYTRWWRYVSLRDVRLLLRACVIAAVVVALLLGLGVVNFGLAYLRRYVGGRFGIDVQHDLRTAIFEHLQRLDVVREARDEDAGALALEVAEREPLHVLEEVDAQVVEHALADPAGEVRLDATEADADDQVIEATGPVSCRYTSTDAFLGAYRDTMGDSAVWPSDRAAAERLLDFFLIEKALYEIEYELAHRPDWLRVPLAGILRILSRPSEETS